MISWGKRAGYLLVPGLVHSVFPWIITFTHHNNPLGWKCSGFFIRIVKKKSHVKELRCFENQEMVARSEILESVFLKKRVKIKKWIHFWTCRLYTVDSVMMICPCRFIGCDRCTSWCRALLMGKAVLIWRQSMQETSLHSLLKVSVVQRLL